MAKRRRTRRDLDQPPYGFRKQSGDREKRAPASSERLRDRQIKSVGTVRSYEERLRQVAASLKADHGVVATL